MKSAFREYYQPTADEAQALWNEATFILDANVLLQLYRYSEKTRDELLGLLELVKNRLWVPYQAGLEFHRSRVGVIQAQRSSYDSLLKDFGAVVAKLKETRQHPFVSTDLQQKFEELLAELEAEVQRSQAAFDGLLGEDPTLDKLDRLFDGRVGAAPAPDKLVEMHKQAAERYEKKRPPGYKDADKPGDEKYGDFLIWRQTLDYAKGQQAPVIFITGDKKEDWWYEAGGRTLGPRVELRAEFSEHVGKPFHMYTTDRFMSFAREYINATVSEEAIQEARTLAVLASGPFSASATTPSTMQHLRRWQISATRNATRLPSSARIRRRNWLKNSRGGLRQRESKRTAYGFGQSTRSSIPKNSRRSSKKPSSTMSMHLTKRGTRSILSCVQCGTG